MFLNYKASDNNKNNQTINRKNQNIDEDNGNDNDNNQNENDDIIIPISNIIQPIFQFFQLENHYQEMIMKNTYNYLKHLSHSQDQLVESCFIKYRISQELIDIFQLTKSFYVMKFVLKFILLWKEKEFDIDQFYDKQFLLLLLLMASQPLCNVDPEIKILSFRILNSYIYLKGQDFVQCIDASFFFPRLVELYKTDSLNYFKSLIAQFLENFFRKSDIFNLDDALSLVDIFGTLPDEVDSCSFNDLLNCVVLICNKSVEFTYAFINGVPISKIISQLPEAPTNSRLSIVGMMDFFLETYDQFVYDNMMQNFSWSLIIPILYESDYNTIIDFSSERRAFAGLVCKILKYCPQTADYEGIVEILQFLIFLTNDKKLSEKLEIFRYLSKLFSVNNPNISDFLIKNNFISNAVEYLESSPDIVKRDIINSIHHIACFAEMQSRHDIFDEMNESGLLNQIIQYSNSENKVVAEAALAILHDESIPMFHSYIDPQ